MSIGQRIKKKRLESDLTLEDLSKLVGVSRQTLSRYETGVIGNISSDKIELIANATHTTPAYLMGWDDLPPNAVPVDAGKLRKVPIMGRIACGKPILAREDIEGYTFTTRNGGAEYFALRARGDSMDAAGIRDGYLVIVRRQDAVDNGQIAVVMVGQEDATLKRFRQDGRTVTLSPQSTNPAHQPIVLDAKKDQYRVLGLVVEVSFSPA